MSQQPQQRLGPCSYPTCDEQSRGAVRFEDGATAEYCSEHVTYAAETYADVVESVLYDGDATEVGTE